MLKHVSFFSKIISVKSAFGRASSRKLGSRRVRDKVMFVSLVETSEKKGPVQHSEHKNTQHVESIVSPADAEVTPQLPLNNIMISNSVEMDWSKT